MSAHSYPTLSRIQPAQTRHARGFTLIELLVVVAIIAILAAMLFPALQRARESAVATSCMNNAKQIGAAYHVYVSEYTGFIPIWQSIYWYGEPNGSGGLDYPAWNTGTNNYYWNVMLKPYVGEEPQYKRLERLQEGGVYFCPALDSKLRTAAYSNYGMFQYGFGGRWHKEVRKITQIKKASQKIVVGDSRWGDSKPTEGNVRIAWFGTWTGFRHPGERANFLYVDSHVEALDIAESNPYEYPECIKHAPWGWMN